MNLASLLLRLVIRAYQLLLSPLMGAHCRFEPSCSCYAHQAVAMHGPLKGVLLATKRVLRCNPLAESGFDPVPPNPRKS